MPRRLLGPIAAAAALLTFVAIALAANPPQPKSPSQPGTDGCQRSYINQLLLKSPEWVYVYKDRTIRTASGIARVTHAAKEDAPGEHLWYDFNSNLVLDKKYSYLLGGDPAAKTSNFAKGDPADREEYKRLHYEWESGTLPFFAWPTEGDRVTLWGSWIWDCGHWQTGKTTTGERTEFHPLNGIVVNRKDPYKTRGNESETDAFVSSDGNLAHAVEECALSHHPASSSTYDAGYRACVQSPGANQQPLAGKYKFFVPAPPKPSAGATLHYRVVKRVSGTPATEKIKVRSNGLAVTVSLKSQPAGKTRRYGKSFFVSWTGAQQPAPTRLKVTFKTLTIKQADPASPKPSEPTSPWNVYLDLNGYWKFVNDWTGSKLLSVKNGQKIKLNKTVPIQVPAGRGVFLLMQGRECDEPAGQTVFGEHVPAIKPCPNELREFKLGNDDIGILLDTYKSPAAAIGTHKSFSVATTHKFPGSGPITFGNGIIGQHTFQLTYVVKPG